MVLLQVLTGKQFAPVKFQIKNDTPQAQDKMPVNKNVCLQIDPIRGNIDISNVIKLHKDGKTKLWKDGYIHVKFTTNMESN